MATVAVEAKPDLAELLERVAAGETVRLTRAGAVVAQLQPCRAEPTDRKAMSAAEAVERIKRNRVTRIFGDASPEDVVTESRES
jgi:prevent-host-death family protein